jgi:hypothetical protein
MGKLSNIADRITRNTYKSDKKQLKQNRKYLEQTRKRLQSRNAASVKYKRAYTKKLETTTKLLQAVAAYPGHIAWINDTLAQGDCFYSSLYRASKERDLLHSIATNLGLSTSTETQFIKSFRNLVADEVKAGRLPSSNNQYGVREDTYDILAGMGDSLGAAIAYGNVFPDWFVASFSKGVGTRSHFQNTFARYARRRKMYVSEIEVDIAKKLLKDRCNILLEITGKTEAVIEKHKEDMPLLTLYNAYGGHYEYYSFSEKCPRGKTRNAKSRRCV